MPLGKGVLVDGLYILTTHLMEDVSLEEKSQFSVHNLAFRRDPIFLKTGGKIKKLGLCEKRDCAH
jgi:hypothetical protein